MGQDLDNMDSGSYEEHKEAIPLSIGVVAGGNQVSDMREELIVKH